MEHYASEAEYIAGQVGKAARVGKNIEREVEEAYGHGARSQGPVNESEDGSEGQQQKTLLSKKTVRRLSLFLARLVRWLTFARLHSVLQVRLSRNRRPQLCLISHLPQRPGSASRRRRPTPPQLSSKT